MRIEQGSFCIPNDNLPWDSQSFQNDRATVHVHSEACVPPVNTEVEPYKHSGAAREKPLQHLRRLRLNCVNANLWTLFIPLKLF